MTGLISNKYFLIMTGLFLAAGIVVIWFFYPPVIRQYNSNRETLTELDDKIAKSISEAADVKDLIADKSTLESLYEKSNLALPNEPSADILLLQLDGLMDSLGLSATIAVPFSDNSLASQVATPTAPTSESEIKAGSGSAGSSQPLITTPGNSANTSFTLSGEWDYPTTLNILTKLKTFIRWNNVKTVDISISAGKSTVTISGQVFWTPPSNLQFTGSAKEMITKAKTLFDSYQSYATTPNIAKEGNFGKSNPFLP